MPTTFNLDKLGEYLEAEDITDYDRDDVEHTIQFEIEGDHGVFEVFFELDAVDGLLLCGVLPPVEFESQHLPQLYECACRANDQLPLGGFQVNTEECMLLFILGAPLDGGDMTGTQLQQILGTALEHADGYTPAFQAAIAGKDIAAAIEEAENREGDV